MRMISALLAGILLLPLVGCASPDTGPTLEASCGQLWTELNEVMDSFELGTGAGSAAAMEVHLTAAEESLESVVAVEGTADGFIDLRDALHGHLSAFISEGRQTERDDYREISWWVFETSAAWLRGERVPGHARRLARKVRKNERAVHAHSRHEDAYKSDAKVPTGVVRQAFRKAKFWLRRHWRKRVAQPVRKLWIYLFAE